MKAIIMFLAAATAINAQAANGWLNEAVCEVQRVDTSTEGMVTDTVSVELVYQPLPYDTSEATAVLNSELIPSYDIIFHNVSTGRGDSVTLKTVQKGSGKVMSTFTARDLFNNSRGVTSESRYTARFKNIFLSDDDRFLLDITCFERAERN